jgi:hypothetical protein
MIAPMEAQPRLASLDASMPWDSMKARSLAVSPSIVIGEYLHVNEAVSERRHHPSGRTWGRIGGEASGRRGAASAPSDPFPQFPAGRSAGPSVGRSKGRRRRERALRQTRFLCEKYGLPLPAALATDPDDDPQNDAT